MEKKDKRYAAYLQILREELVPAMGCTEPIALAYGAAVARDTLGCLPERVSVQVSGNLIKNVKSVIVPNTGGQKGIEAAVVAGLIAGRAEKVLEVIAEVTEAQKAEMKSYLLEHPVTVSLAETPLPFDYTITIEGEGSTVTLRIVNFHTNIVTIEKDGEMLKELPVEGEAETSLTDRSILTIEDIVDFADTVDLADLEGLLEQQIRYNMAIAEEGLRNPYGANVGKTLLKMGSSVSLKARAMAAAGSDARMNGCEMPVVIVSGSGNQGITASVPVLTYARELGIDRERTLRALAVSDLCTIHQKTFIGRLSAFCGAVSAGAGAGAGICYLLGGGYEEIKHTIVNALAFSSGLLCDGAKSSCAAKINIAVEAGIFGYEMYRNGQEFLTGDGIISKGVESTIQNVGEIGRLGMKETDHVILKLMTQIPNC